MDSGCSLVNSRGIFTSHRRGSSTKSMWDMRGSSDQRCSSIQNSSTQTGKTHWTKSLTMPSSTVLWIPVEIFTKTLCFQEEVPFSMDLTSVSKKESNQESTKDLKHSNRFQAKSPSPLRSKSAKIWFRGTLCGSVARCSEVKKTSPTFATAERST